VDVFGQDAEQAPRENREGYFSLGVSEVLCNFQQHGQKVELRGCNPNIRVDLGLVERQI